MPNTKWLSWLLILIHTEEYVTCHTCRSPETNLHKETRLFFLQCETCGSRCSVQNIKSGFQAVTGKRAQMRSKAQWPPHVCTVNVFIMCNEYNFNVMGLMIAWVWRNVTCSVIINLFIFKLCKQTQKCVPITFNSCYFAVSKGRSESSLVRLLLGKWTWSIKTAATSQRNPQYLYQDSTGLLQTERGPFGWE